MSMSNCVIWAYAMWLRRRANGFKGRVYWRRSDWGWFPHCLYGETINGKLRMVSYKPMSPTMRLLPPPLFRGRVCWGDI